MSKSFEVKTKKALFLNGKQITDYEWDNFSMDSVHENVVATDDEKHFALFNMSGDILFEIERCVDYEVAPEYILLKVMYIDYPLYGLISHDGDLLLPTAYKSISKTSNQNILELNMADICRGYYIISTAQTILNAEDFKADSPNEYNFLIKNQWKKYKLVNGKYESIN